MRFLCTLTSVHFAYHQALCLKNSTFCPRSVFMCSVWVWEQTAIISLYNINWLVCITETECVCCAVRTWYLNTIQVMCFVWIWEQTAIISLYRIDWLAFITETERVYCAVRTEYLNIIQVMCFVWISLQTAIISLCSINWLVFITESGCVYCAVRAESLYTNQDNRSLWRVNAWCYIRLSYEFVTIVWSVCFT